MRKLVLMVLSCAVCACVVNAPPGPPPFERGWQFLDGAAASPDDRVDPPVVKLRPLATYPVEARKQRLTGEVGLELTVDDDGRVVKAEVVQPLEPTMDEAALAAAQRWTFTPARLNGAPKASVVRDVVKFSLQ
jgi:TonB family protein